MDAVKNFSFANVTGLYSAAATEIIVENIERFLDPATAGAYNLIWFNNTIYQNPADDPNVEIVRVTAKGLTTLTITRAQEGTLASTKNTVGCRYAVMQGFTKKLYDDLVAATPDSPVKSVFGRTGDIVATQDDYTAEQILETLTRVFLSPEEKEFLNSGLVPYVSGNKDIQLGENVVLWSNGKNIVFSHTGTSYASIAFNNLTDYREYELPNKNGTFALTSDLSDYVPCTGATTNVNLGLHSLTANTFFATSDLDAINITSQGFNLTSNNVFVGSFYYDGYINFDAYTGASIKFGTSDNNIRFWNGTYYANFLLSSLGADRTYTLPNATGTLALTSNIPTVSGTSGQAAFFNGTTSIISDSNFLWDNTNKRLGIGVTPTHPLTVNGDAKINGLTIGFGNGQVNTNVVFGINNFTSNNTAPVNTAIGYNALHSLASGNGENTAIGSSAMYSMATGRSNQAIGSNAMYYNSNGTYNLAIGNSALQNQTTGSFNVGLGYGSGWYAGGSNIVAIGANALAAAVSPTYAVQTVTNSTAIGAYAGYTSRGTYNVFLGYYAGYYETGSNKFFIDNQNRTDEATSRVRSLVYGDFNSTALSQQITFNVGTVNILDGGNIVTGATTGLKLGTAITQKLGFWNVTPIVQPATAAYTSNGQGSAYTGIDNAQAGSVYAQLADLNLLRVAYENLRASYDDLLAKLKTTGIVA